jgi:hypothetical protein
MTEQDIKNKNLVLISYLDSIIDGYKFKAEFSTNDMDLKVVVCQETSGQKVVFYNNDNALFNYFTINVYGDNIKEQYEVINQIGRLIGKSVLIDYNNQKWQLIFKQMANPRAIQYMEIRRVAYTTTLQCIVNRVA